MNDRSAATGDDYAERADQPTHASAASEHPHPPAGPVHVVPAAAGKKHRSPMSGLMFNVLIPLGLLAIGAGVVWALGNVQPKTRAAADNSRVGRLRSLAAVSVDRVRSLEKTGAELQLQVDGVVVPYREVQIATEVAGQIVFKAAECEAGQYVTKGHLLMRIDPTDYELEVERLTRQQEQAYQALRELDQEESNTQKLIEMAQQEVVLRERELKRRQSLPSGFASEGEIDQARGALLAAQQQRLNYENQLDLLRKTRARLEASERLAATELKAAEINLQRAEIRAPIDGVIVREDAELNTFVTRGNPIVTMEDTSKVEVATRLRMDQLHWVLDQARANGVSDSRGYDLPETPAVIEYQVAGRSDQVHRWKGRLLSYDGIGLDPQTRTVPVRIRVDDPRQYSDEQGTEHHSSAASALVRGMYVRVKLLIEPTTELVVIPARAIKPGNRIWEFVPDESVLESVAVGEAGAAEVAAVAKPTKAPGPVTEQATEEDAFDPDQWIAGKVIIRRGIVPVESLDIELPREPVTDEYRSPLEGRRRYWVCEVRGETVEPGSLLVVSPLGNLNEDFLPARAAVPRTASLATSRHAGRDGEGKR